MDSISLPAVLGSMVRLYGEKAPGTCYRSSFSKGFCETWEYKLCFSPDEHCEHPEGIFQRDEVLPRSIEATAARICIIIIYILLFGGRQVDETWKQA